MVSTKTLALAGLYQLTALAAAGLFTLWRYPDLFASLLQGGLVMTVNLFAARVLARKAMEASVGQARSVYVLGLGLKFVLLLTLVTVIMTQLQPDFLAFVAGLCTLFAGMALAVTHQLLSTSSLGPVGPTAR